MKKRELLKRIEENEENVEAMAIKTIDLFKELKEEIKELKELKELKEEVEELKEEINILKWEKKHPVLYEKGFEKNGIKVFDNCVEKNNIYYISSIAYKKIERYYTITEDDIIYSIEESKLTEKFNKTK